MRPRLLTSTLIFLLAAPTFAAEAIIKGKVTDESGQGLVGVAIKLTDDASGRKLSGESEKGGTYYIRGIPPADYTIVVEKEGYTNHTWTGHLPPGPAITMDFQIQSKGKKGASGGDDAAAAAAAAAAAELGKDFQEGVEKFNAKDYDGAIVSFKKVAEKSPEMPDPYYNIGLCYQKKKDYANAITWLTKTTEKKPDHAGAHYNLAFALCATGKTAEGTAAVKKTVELEASADTAFNAGALLKNFQINDAAMEMFQKATERDAGYADAYREIGYLKVASGDMAGAKTALGKYLELAPAAKDAAEVKSMMAELK